MTTKIELTGGMAAGVRQMIAQASKALRNPRHATGHQQVPTQVRYVHGRPVADVLLVVVHRRGAITAELCHAGWSPKMAALADTWVPTFGPLTEHPGRYTVSLTPDGGVELLPIAEETAA